MSQNMPATSGDQPVVIVTGGAKGIGKSICASFLRADCHVVVADARDARQAASELGARAVGVEVDVSDAEQVGAMVAFAAQRFGRIDTLVNNAGIYTSLQKKPFDQIAESEWRRVFEVNVEGVWHCCRHVAAQMKPAGRGCIVNISSASVAKGNPYLMQYVASKGAVQAMTRVLARELGAFGIRVNTVSPGFTLSEGVLEQGSARHDQRVALREARAIREELHPDDVASAVAYLASPAARMVTGQNLTVDGGIVMS